MQLDSVKSYLKSPTNNLPFFLFVSDSQYTAVRDELLVLGFDILPMSNFCSGHDKLPDFDKFCSYIQSVEATGTERKFAVTGLGEYLALRGNTEVERALLRLKDISGCETKVVLVLRGVISQLARLKNDLRFDRQRFFVIDEAKCDLSFTLASSSINLAALSGFKEILLALERGVCGNVIVSTAVNFDKALFTVNIINTHYEAIKFSQVDFDLPRSCGNDDNWLKLLTELSATSASLREIFNTHGLSEKLISDLINHPTSNNYESWLAFIYLKYNFVRLPNGYLRFVLERTNCFEDFSKNILNSIMEIPHFSKQFEQFYKERKTLLVNFSESDIGNFVVNNRKVPTESIYCLTDTTIVEREEVIAWISQNGVSQQVENIYPALAAYLNKYIFKCPELADLLTDYFEEYKRQKVLNRLEADFLDKVDELAKSPHMFNRLPARSEALDVLEKEGTYLYWLDALGVEYLAFIENLAQKRGLTIKVHVVRAELPTITSENCSFFQQWYGPKDKNTDLDEVKHSDSGGYSFENNELPIHLAKELDIISAVIDKAATELSCRHYKRFVITSDHGASRLAVLHRKEERYETDTKGEHSGRCCKLFQPCDLPFAAEENGYLVLADYGRFKGSRAAAVEVHGGASLEEVVIPLIELTLQEEKITVQPVNEFVIVDSLKGVALELFFNAPVRDISLVFNGKAYTAAQIDNQHFTVNILEIRRAGKYFADVYMGDNLIRQLAFTAQGKSGKVNNDFDDLF